MLGHCTVETLCEKAESAMMGQGSSGRWGPRERGVREAGGGSQCWWSSRMKA